MSKAQYPPTLPTRVLTMAIALVANSALPFSAAALLPDQQFHAAVSGGTIHALEFFSDGTILIGGDFTSVNGVARSNLARLNSDGVVDPHFPMAINPAAPVSALANTPEGAVLLAGSFAMPDSHERPNLARIRPDGAVDSSFQPGSPPNGRVNALAPGSDGRIVFGGRFRQVNGSPMVYVGRLQQSGTLDPTFRSTLEPSLALEAGVNALALQPDGKLLAGGIFNVNGRQRCLVRLHSDGTLDGTFSAEHGQMLYLRAILLLPDGRILVAGLANPQAEGFVRRLNSDGTIDRTFTPTTFRGGVETLAVDQHGRIVAGGAFSHVGGKPQSNLVRLTASGTADPSGSPEADGVVKSVRFDSEQRLLVAGAFAEVGGTRTIGIARLKEAPLAFGAMFSANARFKAHLHGVPGKRYRIETSADLRNWKVYESRIATEQGIPIEVDAVRSGTAEFFRARLDPSL